MNRSQAIGMYQSAIVNPAGVSAEDLKRALGILGVDENQFRSDRYRHNEIQSLDARILAAETGENDADAKANAVVRDVQERLGKALEVVKTLQAEMSMALVKQIAAGVPLQKLKQERMRLILAERAADAKLRGEQVGMTFPGPISR
jgi:hypothetical protein